MHRGHFLDTRSSDILPSLPGSVCSFLSRWYGVETAYIVLGPKAWQKAGQLGFPRTVQKAALDSINLALAFS